MTCQTCGEPVVIVHGLLFTQWGGPCRDPEAARYGVDEDEGMHAIEGSGDGDHRTR